MHPEKFLRYIQFGAEDERVLQELWASVEPEVDHLCALFYERVLSDPVTAAVLASPDRVKGLMASLRIWVRELLNGPWDDSYVGRRLRIGRVHTIYGVPHSAMFSAMCVVRNELVRIASRSVDEPATTIQALIRVTELDLALMTSSYHEKRQENAVRDVQNLLIANMPALAVLLDAEFLVNAATPGFRQRFGLEDSVGRDVRILLPKSLQDACSLSELLQRAMNTDRAIQLPRVDFVEAGVRRYFAVTVVPIRDAAGGVLLHMEDHTAAVENEALLQRQESLAHLGTLSATIAHELRNPLAGISGALQVMANTMPADDRFAPIVGKVLDQTRSLNRLVSDLLAFARPRNPSISDALSLRELADRALDAVRADYPRIVVRLDGDAQVAGDADMVRQIVLNLVINACQAMEGEGELSVVFAPGELRISDSGPGIPPSIVGSVFEPFVTTKVRGTGLGLAISQKLARLMGWTLELVDAGGAHPGEGATFRLAWT